MVFFALGESMRQVHQHLGQGLDAALEKVADPGWYLEAETFPYKATVRRFCKLAFKALKGAYNEASKDAAFRHRNWFRNPLTLASIQKQLADLWDIVSENADDYSLIPARKDASQK